MKNEITKKARKTADNRTQVIYYDEHGDAIIAKEFDSNNNILFYHDARTGYRKYFEYDVEGKLIRTLDSNGKAEYRFTEIPIRKVNGGMEIIENELQAEVSDYVIPFPVKVINATRPWDGLITTVVNVTATVTGGAL